MELPKRKSIRLESCDYNIPGAYFITICTNARKRILSKIDVGTGVLDGPKITLTTYGRIAEKYIKAMSDFYPHISVDKYVIMPNHIHLLIQILNMDNGPSRTPVPTTTKQNSTISRFVSTFKRFCNKEYGQNIWQYRSFDHIIRGDKDYDEIWRYIDENPAKWKEDRFYIDDSHDDGLC